MPWQSGTTLAIANSTGTAVPVMVTLGAGYGINNVNQLPWNVKPVGSALQGIFTLNANSSVSFNSGSKSFSGNTAFCTAAPNPPNPTNNCPAPKNRPPGPQLQTRAQCNIQRSGPTGGIVQIVFAGYAPHSAPLPNCN